MNTDRPNFEALYKIAYRKHHELLNEIDDLTSRHLHPDSSLTGNDAMGELRLIHEKYTVSDFN